MLRKKISAALALVLCAVTLLCPVCAEVNGGTVPGVSEEMCFADFWADRCADPDRLLADADTIRDLNRRITDASETSVFDLTQIREETDADALRLSLADDSGIPTRDLYLNGKKLNNTLYYRTRLRAIERTGYRGQNHPNEYAIAVRYAPVRGLPTNDVIGYSAADPDDELCLSALLVGEPFVIRQKCSVGGELFYWGYGTNITGWVDAKNLAVCETKQQWINFWQTDPAAKDVLVVTQGHISLEPSLLVPDTSEVRLTFGTVLKLVPPDEIREPFGERGSVHNYVVRLPVRTVTGGFAEKQALIPAYNSVSVGFLPLTQRNLLRTAFRNLGNRYGWGNMLFSMDCSGFVRNLYRCFGLSLPRNTVWQQLVPGTHLSLEGLEDEEKAAVLARLPAGSALYFPGHAMIYTGSVDSVPYVISVTGAMRDRPESDVIRSIYGTVLSPMTVRRANGLSWLASLDGAVLSFPHASLEDCTVSVSRTDSAPAVCVSDGDVPLTEGSDYTVRIHDDRVVLLGQGNYFGAVVCPIPTFCDVLSTHQNHKHVEWAVEKGIVFGSENARFLPDALLSRAAWVTMLHRAAGAPVCEAAVRFTDVAEDAYYAAAVRWAVSCGIVCGTDETHFSPELPCTEYQADLMLNRYVTYAAGTQIVLPSQNAAPLTRTEAVVKLFAALESGLPS